MAAAALNLPQIATPSINDVQLMQPITADASPPDTASPTQPQTPTQRRRRPPRPVKKRCAALDYLSDSPRKKRGRKVKKVGNLPPIQKQPYFLVFPDLRLKCPQCDHIASCQGTLVQHLRTHPESRKCPVCNKQFSTQQNLIKHARLHSGERPYPCPIPSCRWAYKQKGDLLAHCARGKHGSASDNNRKPPEHKFYNGATKLPTLHAITKEDVMAAPDLKQLIISLRKREEQKKTNKESVRAKRKQQLDDFVLSMFLSIYDIDNHEMRSLLQVARQKYAIKQQQQNQPHIDDQTETVAGAVAAVKTEARNAAADDKHREDEVANEDDDEELEEEDEEASCDEQEAELALDALPAGAKVKLDYKFLVNRVYGDFSIVLVPVHSVPSDELNEATPEIVIDPSLIPALQQQLCAAADKSAAGGAVQTFDELINNPYNAQILSEIGLATSPARSHQTHGGSDVDVAMDGPADGDAAVLERDQELDENHIVLAKTSGALGVNIGNLSRKRVPYLKFNQTAEGFWQCDAPNCHSLFLSKARLEQHCAELHASGYYGCKYCRRMYRSQKNVQNHLRKAHEKHGDEYLNALIYNKFSRVIRVTRSRWNQLKRGGGGVQEYDGASDEHAMVYKSVVIKTHDIDSTILRKAYDDGEDDGDDGELDSAKQQSSRSPVLVPWQQTRSATTTTTSTSMATPTKRKTRVKRETENNSETKGKNVRRPRGRPKGSKSKTKPKKKANPNKKQSEDDGDQEDEEDDDLIKREAAEAASTTATRKPGIDGGGDGVDAYGDGVGTIYDDIDGDQMSVYQDEKSILEKDVELDQMLAANTRNKRGQKRKRAEFELDDNGETRARRTVVKTEATAMDMDLDMDTVMHMKDEHATQLPSDVFGNIPNFDIAWNSLPTLGLPTLGALGAAGITSQQLLQQQQAVQQLPQLPPLPLSQFPAHVRPPLQQQPTDDLHDLLSQFAHSQQSANHSQPRRNSFPNGAMVAIDQQQQLDFDAIDASSYSYLIDMLAKTAGGNDMLMMEQSASAGAAAPLSQPPASYQQAQAYNDSMHELSQLMNPNRFSQQSDSHSNSSYRDIDTSSFDANHALLAFLNNNMSQSQQIQPQSQINASAATAASSSSTFNAAADNSVSQLNNYGKIVNNTTYLLRKMHTPQNARGEGVGGQKIEPDARSESPFIPPLVDAVCGAHGCHKIKREDGTPLLMCGRCFSIKYCSKQCQIAHIYEHRKVCEKKV